MIVVLGCKYDATSVGNDERHDEKNRDMGLRVVGGLFGFEDRVGSNGMLEAPLQGRRSGFGHLLDSGGRYRYQKRQPSEGRDSTRVADIYRISALSK